MSPPAESGFDPGAETPGGISVETVSIDHMSLVRYVHATALRMQSADELTEDEIERFCDGVYAPHYTMQLMAQDLIGAWIGGELAGTAGWSLSEDGSAARIGSVFVRPPFTRIGIGRRLIEAIETRARTAGLSAFDVRAIGNSAPFFEKLGYRATALGLAHIAMLGGIPVTSMHKADAARQAPPDAATEPAAAEG
jgi:GNAT superfamily N-acetyltransferase